MGCILAMPYTAISTARDNNHRLDSTSNIQGTQEDDNPGGTEYSNNSNNDLHVDTPFLDCRPQWRMVAAMNIMSNT